MVLGNKKVYGLRAQPLKNFFQSGTQPIYESLTLGKLF